jgi:hypothetical protein
MTILAISCTSTRSVNIMPSLPSIPPRCLHSFSYRQVKPQDAGLPRSVTFNCFTLVCPCGSDVWRVHGYWLGLREDFVGPLAVQCVSCRVVRELINTDRDGYDAEIGDSCVESGKGARQVWMCDSCKSSDGPLIASFGYQFEPDAEVALRHQDYFDAFILTHFCRKRRKAVQVAMFECA